MSLDKSREERGGLEGVLFVTVVVVTARGGNGVLAGVAVLEATVVEVVVVVVAGAVAGAISVVVAVAVAVVVAFAVVVTPVMGVTGLRVRSEVWSVDI